MPFSAVKLSVCVAVLLVMSGCQTLSPTECRIANWAQLGQQDGNAGLDEKIALHVEGCAKQQVMVAPSSVAAYRTGYQQGLGYYCRKDRVLELALTGKHNIDVCPLASQGALRPYATVGARVHETRSTLQDLTREQRQLEQERQQDNTTEVRRVEIRKRLRQLDQDLMDQRLDVARAESALRQLH
ncbi:MAG: hypothetical protein RL180_1652 [Pseudomonadota bacterium]